MKINLFAKERRSPTSIAIAVVANALMAVAIGAITFYTPLSELLHPPKPVEVHVAYIRVAPTAAAPQSGQRGASDTHVTKPVVTPERVTAPTTIPTALPPITPAAPNSGQVGIPGASGKSATNGAGSGVTPLTGIEPAMADPRLALEPAPFTAPRSVATRNDSAISPRSVYRDSVMATKANPKRAPGDWTFDHDGKKWGWDPTGIHIAGFTIPNAIFAALPLKIGPTGRSINALTDQRMADWTQKDIYDHQQTMSDDDFRAAIKRIRDREDREHSAQGGTVVANKPPQ